MCRGVRCFPFVPIQISVYGSFDGLDTQQGDGCRGVMLEQVFDISTHVL